MPENLLVVNAEGPEIRVGVLENGTLAEYYAERKRDRGIVGNIYVGQVNRILPGMQAAFVDLGPTVERAAFLHAVDLVGSGQEQKLFDVEDNDGAQESRSRSSRGRKQQQGRKITELLKPQQKILVQIVKDPIGQKGARVTGYVSLPGRYSVLMPAVDQVGISRRISSEKERKRLRAILSDVRPKGAGLIVRTAAEVADSQEVRDDVDYLVRLWGQIGKRKQGLKKPGLVYGDLDLVLRTIRDFVREDTREIWIDSEEQYARAKKFLSAFLPRYVERIHHYTARAPIFDHYGIEESLRSALGRKVPLRSGGYLIIDQHEALTSIDVNTGSFVGTKGLEQTVTQNNLEATKEIAHQLRLRNIGGIIVLDYVDMEREENRRRVWNALHEALATDRSRCNVTKISELGLVEMTRKRTRESLNQMLTETCPTCHGTASIKSTVTLANEILREVRRLGSSVAEDTIKVECTRVVADHISSFERDYVDELEKRFQKQIEICAAAMPAGEYRVAGQSNEAVHTGKPRSSRKSGEKSRAKRNGVKRSNSNGTKEPAAPKSRRTVKSKGKVADKKRAPAKDKSESSTRRTRGTSKTKSTTKTPKPKTKPTRSKSKTTRA